MSRPITKLKLVKPKSLPPVLKFTKRETDFILTIRKMQEGDIEAIERFCIASARDNPRISGPSLKVVAGDAS